MKCILYDACASNTRIGIYDRFMDIHNRLWQYSILFSVLCYLQLAMSVCYKRIHALMDTVWTDSTHTLVSAMKATLAGTVTRKVSILNNVSNVLIF